MGRQIQHHSLRNIMPANQYRRYTAAPQALITDIEGVLMDPECNVVTTAIQELYKRRDFELSLEDATPPCATLDELGSACHTQLRNVLRGVVRKNADKWAAAKGAPPTEWDMEAMFKEMPQVCSLSLTLLTLPVAGRFRSDENRACAPRRR